MLKGCPLHLAGDLSKRVQTLNLSCPIVIVAANRMFENWFLASLETIRGRTLEGRTGIRADMPIPDDPETTNGKRYLNARFPPGRAYKETEDQEAMTRLMDIALAQSRSRSFQRLIHAVEEAVLSIQSATSVVTPVFPIPSRSS